MDLRAAVVRSGQCGMFQLFYTQLILLKNPLSFFTLSLLLTLATLHQRVCQTVVVTSAGRPVDDLTGCWSSFINICSAKGKLQAGRIMKTAQFTYHHHQISYLECRRESWVAGSSFPVFFKKKNIAWQPEGRRENQSDLFPY